MLTNIFFGGLLMKKLLALMLALLMMATTLVACSDKEETEEDLKDYLQNDEVEDHYEVKETSEIFYCWKSYLASFLRTYSNTDLFEV